MKTLILALFVWAAYFLIQGCVAYAEPVGPYYYRGGIWYYHDVHGHEWRENRRYHHPPDQHYDEHR